MSAPRCPQCGSFKWFHRSEEMVSFEVPIIDAGDGGYKLGEEKTLGFTPGRENAINSWYQCANGHRFETDGNEEHDETWDEILDWCLEWF